MSDCPISSTPSPLGTNWPPSDNESNVVSTLVWILCIIALILSISYVVYYYITINKKKKSISKIE